MFFWIMYDEENDSNWKSFVRIFMTKQMYAWAYMVTSLSSHLFLSSRNTNQHVTSVAAESCSIWTLETDCFVWLNVCVYILCMRVCSFLHALYMCVYMLCMLVCISGCHVAVITWIPPVCFLFCFDILSFNLVICFEFWEILGWSFSHVTNCCSWFLHHLRQ